MRKLIAWFKETKELIAESKLFTVSLIGMLLLYAIQVMDIIPSWYWYSRWSFENVAGVVQTCITVVIVQGSAFYVTWQFRQRLLTNLRLNRNMWHGENLMFCAAGLTISLVLETLHLWTYWGDKLSTGNEPFRMWRLGYGSSWGVNWLVFALSVVFPVLGVILTFINVEEIEYDVEKGRIKETVKAALTTGCLPSAPRGQRAEALAEMDKMWRRVQIEEGADVEVVLAEFSVDSLVGQWGISRRTAQLWRKLWREAKDVGRHV